MLDPEPVDDPRFHKRYITVDPQCGFNKMEVPKGSTPLYQIMEEYARDQDAWLRDFVPAFEKNVVKWIH